MEARRPRDREARAARARHDPRRLRAVAVRRRVRRAGRRASVTAALPRRARRSSTSAPSPTSPTGPTRSTSSSRSSRSSTTASTSRSSGAAPAGCRFCQAGMITRPVRERPDEQVRTMVRDGLRRTGYDEVALTSLSSADFSGIDGVVADLVARPGGHRRRERLAAEPARRRVHASGIASEIQKVRRTGLTFAPEAGTWRLRQVINKLITRGRPLRRGRRRVLAGLAAREALLPHRPAHRDGRRHARHRRARAATSSTIGRKLHQAGELHGVGRRVRPQAAHAVPVVRPERRRRAAAQDQPAARRAARHRRAGEVARPAGDVRRGDRQPRRPADRPGHRGGLAGRRHLPGVERALRARPLARRDGAPRASTPTGTSPATAPATRCSPGPTSRPACTDDFLWDDWQAALAEHGLPDCRWTPCYDCGVCTDYALEHVVASPVAPAGGSQGTGQDLSGRRRRAGPVPRCPRPGARRRR